MAEETAPQKLNPDQVLPSVAAPPVPETPAAQTLAGAPAAMRRSMPMALSICGGILLAALAGWFFYYLTWLILVIYLSFIAATILDAPVVWLKRHHIRRGFAAVIVMVGGLAIVSSVGYVIGNGVYNEVSALSYNLERAPRRINDAVNGIRKHFLKNDKQAARGQHDPSGTQPAPATQPVAITAIVTTQPAATAPTTEPGDFDVAKTIGNSLPNFSTIWANTLRSIEAISWIVIIFFIVLYMLVDGADHLKAGRTLLPKNIRLESTKLFNEICRAHRGWALASVANVLSAAVLTSTGLYFLGVPGALILGFFAGLGELIPNIGPIFGALPALLLTLIAEPDKFIYVVGMFIIVQTVQSYTISPMMLKFSIEMPVLVTIISVLVFGTLFGFLGVLVAIPFVADMVVVWNYVQKWREKDTQDYDLINAPVDDRREAMAADNTKPSRLKKLFRRERQRAAAVQASAEENGTAAANGASAPAVPATPKPSGMDHLEAAEKRS